MSGSYERDQQAKLGAAMLAIDAAVKSVGFEGALFVLRTLAEDHALSLLADKLGEAEAFAKATEARNARRTGT